MLGRIKNRIRRVGSDSDQPINRWSSLQQEQHPSTSSNNNSGGGHHHHHNEQNDEDYHAKLTDLASFDACVEACDALAASPSNSPNAMHAESGMMDCSVIVSPDGDLLLVPQTKEEKELEARMSLDCNKQADYDSSVILGNDLQPAHELNGFSAMGWSAAAASLAIRQTEQTMRHTEAFLSQVHQASVDSQKQHLLACHQLRQMAGIGEYPSASQSFPPTPLPKSMRSKQRRSSVDLNLLSDLEPTGSSWKNGSGNGWNSLERGPHRVGPLVYSGSSLYAAMIAIESYYTRVPVYRPTVQQQLTERADQTAERAYHREKTLKEMQRRANAAELKLSQAKAHARQRWQMVHEAEELVSHIVEERMLSRSQARERQRLQAMEDENRNHQRHAVDSATSEEIWKIVAAATANMENGDFTPIDFPSSPMAGVMDLAEQSDRLNGIVESSSGSSLSSIPMASRASIEQECNLPALRSAAMAAEDAVEDAAQALWNCLSILDTTRRSARVAAETSLLAACNAQAESLQRIVQLERMALQERMARLDQLEQVTSEINVRQDLNRYIMVDKKERGGSTWMGDYDDGGIASALATLSSHVVGSTGMGPGSPMRSHPSWTEESDEATSPEVLEDAINEIFETDLNGDAEQKASFDQAVQLLCQVAADRKAPRSKRSVISYALNAKRTSAEFTAQENFDSLCKVFDAILTGCDHEPGGVANAKMCMMLSQTFYIVDASDSDEAETLMDPSSPTRAARSKRIYVKSRLIGHALWDEDEFWDQALHQCVTESLTHSGVMANFDRGDRNVMKKSEWMEARKLQWHDLTHAERSEAASQVHAVVFAQLGALAHSMMEFGCGMERSCAFVRRMSVRNQLPISQRTMLLQHLVGKANITDGNTDGDSN